MLNDAPLALAYRVLRDGRLLVSRDDDARSAFWVRTVDRYLDMAPARRLLDEGSGTGCTSDALVDPEIVQRRLREIGRER